MSTAAPATLSPPGGAATAEPPRREGMPPAAALVAAVAFALLFHGAATSLLRDWWDDPDAAHGLLLAPVAGWLAWRAGIVREPRPARAAGMLVLVGATALRWLSELAAEPFTLRVSLLGAAAGLLLFALGWRQLARWWLPAMLLVLSVPLPDVVTGSLALPLQLVASRLGAEMLEWRHVPVLLAGNVIHLPGRSLFVTEACSGLRSLSALLALGLLLGGLRLRRPPMRVLLLALALPVAVLLNGLRVFLTGYLVHYVSPSLGEGFLHMSEGLLLFVVAFAFLCAVAEGLARLETRLPRRAA